MTKTEEFMVNMGPQHPSTHGVLKLVITMDGEVVTEVVPHIGFLHRNFEKFAENRTYPQFMPYVDRLDYVAAMTNEFAYALAVEKLLNIKVPPRAEYLRVMVAELQRIASHLIFFGAFAGDAGALTPFLYSFREREKIVEIFEMLSGARLTYHYFRIGGLANDLPDAGKQKVKEFIDYFLPKVDEYDRLLSDNAIFRGRTEGIGILPSDKAIAWGVTGPMLRASGVPWDLRKDDPYSAYPELDFNVVTASTGDCFDRYRVRVEEMRESCKIIRQAVDKLPAGEFRAKVPRILRPPQGEVYARIEAPRGELGFYIKSDGSPKPYRLKIRAPSFSNLSVLPEISRGLKIADLVLILGSVDIVLGEVDR